MNDKKESKTGISTAVSALVGAGAFYLYYLHDAPLIPAVAGAILGAFLGFIIGYIIDHSS